MFLYGNLDGKTVAIPYSKVNMFFNQYPDVALYGKPIKENPYGEDNHPLKTVMTD